MVKYMWFMSALQHLCCHGSGSMLWTICLRSVILAEIWWLWRCLVAKQPWWQVSDPLPNIINMFNMIIRTGVHSTLGTVCCLWIEDLDRWSRNLIETLLCSVMELCSTRGISIWISLLIWGRVLIMKLILFSRTLGQTWDCWRQWAFSCAWAYWGCGMVVFHVIPLVSSAHQPMVAGPSRRWETLGHSSLLEMFYAPAMPCWRW